MCTTGLEGRSIAPQRQGCRGMLRRTQPWSGMTLPSAPALRQPWMVGSVWSYSKGNVRRNSCGVMVFPPCRW
jgi:hypothetical protein